jgi:hypothetical protein
VTAVNSAIMVLAALLQGVDQVVFSNERSASYGSQIAGHRRSEPPVVQGLGVREGVRRTCSARGGGPATTRCCAAVRAGGRQFAKTDFYDAHFSSCNRNFHILGERPVNRWCGVCPKPFRVPGAGPVHAKTRLVRIFGRNLLDDAEQAGGFDALLEFQDHKPFECVGEGRESRAAMATWRSARSGRKTCW